jgi:N-acetylneuraminic acid mutarotase
VTQHPNAVYGAVMVFDGNRSLLFGGSDVSDFALAETWTFDGSDWAQIAPAASPPARTNYAMIYDANNGRILLFGGQNKTAYFNDLWQYDGNNWSPATVVGSSPPPRALHSMTYDADDGLVFLFGGRSLAGDLLADFWSFNTATNEWTKIAASGPSARQAASLIYDPARGDLVLVGGVSEHGDIVLNDVWHYRDSAWTEAAPVPVALGAAYHWLVYDQAEQAIVLFANGETWQYK